MINVDNKDDFIKSLNLIKNHKNYLKKQQLLLKKSALEWGRSDGNSTKTIINEINKIIKND